MRVRLLKAERLAFRLQHPDVWLDEEGRVHGTCLRRGDRLYRRGTGFHSRKRTPVKRKQEAASPSGRRVVHGPEFVSVEELAKTDFGKEIAFDVISNGLSPKEAEEKGLYDSATGEPNYDAVSDEDIKGTLEDELKDLGDLVWERFGETNQKALGAAVKAFLTDKLLS